MTELTGDVDDASSFMEKQRREAVAQVVRAGMGQARCERGASERPAAPRLIRRLGPRMAVLAGNHEFAVVRTTGGHSPRAQNRAERGQQAHCPVLARLRVSLLTERHRALDKDCPLPDVSPSQPKRLAGTETRVSERRDQRRVTRVERRAHRLDRPRRQRLHLLSARPPRLLHSSDGFSAIRPETNACSSTEPSRSMAWRTATGPAPSVRRSACQRPMVSGPMSRSAIEARYGRT